MLKGRWGRDGLGELRSRPLAVLAVVGVFCLVAVVVSASAGRPDGARNTGSGGPLRQETSRNLQIRRNVQRRIPTVLTIGLRREATPMEKRTPSNTNTMAMGLSLI